MIARHTTRLAAALAGLAVGPGAAAARPIGPSVVVDAPGRVRAAASFLLVVAFGGVLLYQYDSVVDRSVEAFLERPLAAAVYGVLAYALVGFLGTYAYSQMARIGVDVATVSAVVGGVVLALAGFGFVVVGTTVTDVFGARRPWTGLVVGGALSAAGWLLLPLLAAVVAWTVLAAVGIGGPARKWVHADRSIESELGS
ncbi:hypothetical protein [Halomicrococcus gelatinilyticus]|uniref:hypothetical protein n=1 Tax=Halomicrococcus gelatinilyticus TaxID=1702103 RepID=UPI002E113E48